MYPKCNIYSCTAPKEFAIKKNNRNIIVFFSCRFMLSLFKEKPVGVLQSSPADPPFLFVFVLLPVSPYPFCAHACVCRYVPVISPLCECGDRRSSPPSSLSHLPMITFNTVAELQSILDHCVTTVNEPRLVQLKTFLFLAK